jgi:hypothetical protein
MDDLVFIGNVFVFIGNVTDFNDIVKILLINHNNNINRKGITHMKKYLESLKYGIEMYGKAREITWGR